MKILRTVNTALRALRRNPMRAFLTTLGIVIGVGAVIAMMEIGEGSSAVLKKQIASLGANNLIVLPGAAASTGVSFGGGTSTTLTPQDCVAIIRDCPAIRAGAPIVRVRGQVVYGNKNWVPNTISGTTPEFLNVRDWTELTDGEMFGDRDVANANRVCVVGQTIVRELFGGISPVKARAQIRIQNVAFTVVGVLSSKGANMMGMDQDDVILAPWTTVKFRMSGTAASATAASAASASSDTSSAVNSLSDLYPSKSVALYPTPSAIQAADTPVPVRFTNVDQVLVAARSAPEIPTAIDQMTDLLRERHRINLAMGEVDDFNIRDMTEMTKMLSSTTTLMTNLLLGVALISLIVGGVGIMNIMLVSVTERTREIGLRMAVGARSRDIMRQFLVEAVVLCLVGGALGIALGVGGSILVTALLHWPVQTSPTAIILAVVVSAAVGILFGFYPAWRASRLDPIEALRYE
ncbi:MAG: ABC transporter permease [Planctomycetota bacterium]|nr:ABC transporter permease [Planctomycetota bacterium]